MTDSNRWVGFLVLAVILMVIPWLLPNNYYFDIAIKIGFNALVVVGLNLLIGYAGQISLGHAAFFGIGAYSSAILAGTYGVNHILAMAAGAGGTALLALAVGWPILRLSGHYLAMGTLAIGFIIATILSNEAWLTGGPDGMLVPMLELKVEIFGVSLLDWGPSGYADWYGIVAFLLLAGVFFTQNIVDSPMGRVLRAVHTSEVAARTCGIDTAWYKVMVFMLSAVYASITGSLFAHYETYITPVSADFLHSILLVTMVVLGGMGSIYGPIVGAAILTILPQVLTEYPEVAEYEVMIMGAILMLVMIFLRRGVLPSLADLVRGGRRG